MSQLHFTRLTILTASIALTLASVPALSCGPDFPLQLLSERGTHLQNLPEPEFALLVTQLASMPAAWPQPAKTFHSQYDYQTDRLVSSTEQAEQQLLPAEQAKLIATMRQQTDAAAALQAGKDLSDELRFYTAGAVVFSKDPKAAATLFQQVLALPATAQQQRRSWALYSLARLQAETAPEQAIQLWQKLRAEVAAGLADPLQLAVASLGEEARLLLAQQRWQQAIGLYATQAHYDASGYASLLQLSRQLLTKPDAELQPLLQQPAVSRLLSIYLLTQLSGLQYSAPQQLTRLLQLLQQTPEIQLANALELAAVSYQQGQYDNAAILLKQAADSPLKWWLSAKLALRSNDLTAAAAAYAKASKAFPTALPAPAKAPEYQYDEAFSRQISRKQLQTQCRVEAEAGVLALQRGEYLQAMRLLYQAGAEFWQDTAYIAERVLTTAELQQFVDAEVPTGQAKADSQWSWFGDTEPNTLLRQLLARRLLREGQTDAALRYFVEPKLQQLAQQYQQLQQKSSANALQHQLERLGLYLQLDFGQLGRADALFQLARLTRQHGLELLGYELAPDYQVFYGQFEFYQSDTPPLWPMPTAEQQRLTQTAPVPDKRFHYRYVAADLAAQSAELWPQNSQAYAASLCAATTWLINRDPEIAQQYYRRYLQHGAYVPWGADFGIRCPEPDAVSAEKRLRTNFQTSLPRQRDLALGGGTVLLLAGAGWWALRRRKDVSRSSN
ncbi:hypothetical protein [Rheinheimera texasensis]|uniref:hypothetical protein n=1 Tax=Rheinheimera texasensis TaxID=306205 RepID=UPI0032B24D94